MNRRAWWEVIVPYKGRELVFGERVQVYRNLHKTDGGHVWFSIKKGGYVVAHTTRITISEVEFQVNEAGRQRVLREKKKNVHAFVTGRFWGIGECGTVDGSFHYNPYKCGAFVDADGVKLSKAVRAYLCGEGGEVTTQFTRTCGSISAYRTRKRVK